jgi:glycosyltransferase involved in cell wall biosynthesis
VKIAILGSRGIPVSYGGFETLAEELSTRLVHKGHDVTVYCCGHYSITGESTYKGVKRVVLPTIRTKVLEKPVFAFLSLLSSSVKNYDVILMLGISVSFFCFIPRLSGEKVIINIDGLEWQRRKWGPVISRLLRFEERMAGVMADMVVTDCRWVKEYYSERYGKDSAYIPYGAEIIDYPPGNTLRKHGLNKDEYILYVSRFEPENNALLVREAFDSIESPAKKLVMVGDAPYADAYIKQVKNTGNPAIIFTGYQYGDAYRELLSNAYLYIQATEVGGTHPALVEAMGAGNCVLANDVPEHREVLRDAGFYYKGKEDLKEKMLFLMDNKENIREKKKAALEVIGREYSWEKITDEYERLFLNLVER